jgi:predicted phosphodiesterase
VSAVAALYDIHGNLPALEAVLAEVPEDAAVVIGGDFVGGPWPRQTVARLRGLDDRALWLHGNADREVAAEVQVGMSETARRSLQWSAEQLDDEDKDFIRGLPLTVSLEVDGLGATLFCHGSPRSDEEIITSVTSDERLRRIVRDVDEKVVVCGHTHQQFDRVLDGRRVVNAGSIGMPYEGEVAAYWALLGPDVELRRTAYDVAAMLDAMADTAYPEQQYLRDVLRDDIPVPQEVAEFFEQRALELERA